MDSLVRKRDANEDEGVKKNVAKQKKNKKSKKTKKREAADAEERRLTALIFGRGEVGEQQQQVAVRDVVSRPKEAPPQTGKKENDGGDLLFEIDRAGDDVALVTTDASMEQASAASAAFATALVSNQEDSKNGPAWVDDEDARMQVNLLETGRLRKLRTSRTEEAASALNGVELEQRMRQRHQNTMQQTARTDWADISPQEEGEEQDEEDQALQGSSISLLRQSGKRRLKPSTLDIVRCPDANLTDPSSAVLRSVQFHPGSDPDSPLLLTAGFDKTLRFFQVGSEGSKKIHGIHFPNFPIYSASFLGSTGNVICTSRRKHFYIYNAEAGKMDHVPNIIGREEKSLEYCRASPDGRIVAFAGNDGFIVLFDTHSKQWIADLKINGSVRTLAFSPDGEQILASGSDGDVYRWDMKSNRCMERFSNVDGTACTALAMSDQHLAVGAHSGVVNLYDSESYNMQQQENNARTPIKSILNLQTSIHQCQFNQDGQILAMGTKMEQRGLKLMHVPTATVFANWPTANTPLGYVWSMDFSPESQFFATGNDKGKCLLYQLKHYCE